MSSPSQRGHVSAGTLTEAIETFDPLRQTMQRIRNQADRLATNIESLVDLYPRLREDQGGLEMSDDDENDDDIELRSFDSAGAGASDSDPTLVESEELLDTTYMADTEDFEDSEGFYLDEPSENRDGQYVAGPEETPIENVRFDPRSVVDILYVVNREPLAMANGLRRTYSYGILTREEYVLSMRFLRETFMLGSGPSDDEIVVGGDDDDEDIEDDDAEEEDEDGMDEGEDGYKDDGVEDSEDRVAADEDQRDDDEREDSGNSESFSEYEDSDYFTQAPTQHIPHQRTVANSAHPRPRVIDVSNIDCRRNAECRNGRAFTVFMPPEPAKKHRVVQTRTPGHRSMAKPIALTALYLTALAFFLFALYNTVAMFLLQCWKMLNPGPWRTIPSLQDVLACLLLIYALGWMIWRVLCLREWLDCEIK